MRISEKNFERELTGFQDFLSMEGLGALSPVQCEVTYVNVIMSEGVWSSHSDLGKIIPSANSAPYRGFFFHHRSRRDTPRSTLFPVMAMSPKADCM